MLCVTVLLACSSAVALLSCSSVIQCSQARRLSDNWWLLWLALPEQGVKYFVYFLSGERPGNMRRKPLGTEIDNVIGC